MANSKRFSPGVFFAFAFALTVAGCGGVKNSGGGSANLPTSGPSAGGSSPVVAPIIVQVGSGATVSGINIAVSSPAASTSPNAQLLGVFAGSGVATASNTGDIIHRGETASVLVFGVALDGSMTVTIGGPSDIQITNVHSITSTNGTPGVGFTAAVSGNAALGARTVFLQNTQSDITAFTGGLEVVQ